MELAKRLYRQVGQNSFRRADPELSAWRLADGFIKIEPPRPRVSDAARAQLKRQKRKRAGGLPRIQRTTENNKGNGIATEGDPLSGKLDSRRESMTYLDRKRDRGSNQLTMTLLLKRKRACGHVWRAFIRIRATGRGCA